MIPYLQYDPVVTQVRKTLISSLGPGRRDRPYHTLETRLADTAVVGFPLDTLHVLHTELKPFIGELARLIGDRLRLIGDLAPESTARFQG